MKIFDFTKKTFVAVFVFFIGCILVEMCLRLFGFTHINHNTFDSKNLIIFKPNSVFTVKDICYSADIKINSFGFHSKEYPFEKPKNTFRIVILGDSFVEAAQVPLEKTFFVQLEEKLNEMSTGTQRYEVIALGKSGHGTLKNLVFAREYGLKFQPDLIIENFITNDLEEDFFDIQNLHAHETEGQYDALSLRIDSLPENKKKVLFVKHFIFEKSILLERLWMNGVIVKSGLKKSAQPLDTSAQFSEAKNVETLLQVLLDPQGKIAQNMWDIQSKSLSTFSNFIKQNKTRFLVVHLTEGFFIEPTLRGEWNASPDDIQNFSTSSVKDHLQTIAEKEGFAFFSTQEYFEQQYKKTHTLPVWKCDNHYNAVGHEWVANALFDFLLKNKKQFLNV